MNTVVLFSTALMSFLMAAPVMSEEARVVTVSGNGEVLAAPDEAQVTLTVMARAEQQAPAQRQADQTVAAVMRVIDQLGIEKKRVRTTGVNISPEFRWDKDTNERKITGYVVQRAIEVNLNELEKLGELMQRATAAGVNQVSPPMLGASNEKELRREALALAATDARQNAQVLASTLGAKLGAVRRITSSDVVHQPPVLRNMARAEMMAADGGGAETYTSGEIRFHANVTVEFDLDIR